MEFLRYVTEDLYGKFGGELKNVTIVLPSRRAGLFIKDCLAGKVADKPLRMPECITIVDLFDELCDLHAVDEIRAVSLLYDIYCAKTTPAGATESLMTLDAFYGWGRQLIADFNNADKNAVDTTGENIFRSSAEAQELSVTRLDPEVRERLVGLIKGDSGSITEVSDDSFRKAYERLWGVLPEIYVELKERLLQDGYGLDGARCRRVIDRFDEVWPTICHRTFVFVGFNLLLGVEKKLMHLIADEGKALFYWDYNEQFHKEEPFLNVYDNVKRNFEEFGGLFESKPSVEKSIKVVSALSDDAQARYVNTWLRENAARGSKTAVVLCNELMLQPVVSSVPEEMSGRVNVTRGFPMKQTDIFAKISKWLRTVDVEQNSPGGVLGKLLAYIDAEWEMVTVDSAKDEDSADLKWYDLLAIESVYQARCVVVRLKRFVDDGTLAKVGKLSTLRNLLMNLLGSVDIPFHGEPITEVQVMGVLETRTLDFDNLLLLNVEEGVIPRKHQDHSFIPYYLRKYYRLTTADEEAEVYAYNFFRLLRRARNINIMYSNAQTAEGRKTMSRFLMQIMTSVTLRDRVERYMLLNNRPADSLAETQSVSTKTPNEDLPPGATAHKTYADKLRAQIRKDPSKSLSLSPTAITTYLGCKRKFYYRYMLDIDEPVNDRSLLTPAEIGTLVHNSIEASYAIITDGGRHPSVTPEQIRSFLDNPRRMDEAVDNAYGEMNNDYRRRCCPSAAADTAPDYYVRSQHPVETEVAKAYLRNILEGDSHLVDFKIEGNELRKFFRANVSGVGEIQIGGSIDRLDMVTETQGRILRIVDYKTGRYEPEKMKVGSLEELFEPDPRHEHAYVLQTMIYSLACLDDPQIAERYSGIPVKPQLLFTQKNLSDFSPDLSVGGEVIKDFNKIKQAFREGLLRLVETILAEEEFALIEADGALSPCDNCAYNILCDRRKRS